TVLVRLSGTGTIIHDSSTNGIVPTVCGIHCVYEGARPRPARSPGSRRRRSVCPRRSEAVRLVRRRWSRADRATFDRFGFRPGKLNAIGAGLGEAGGGALLA